VGLRRELSERFLALASHYLFEPCFARPGEGHDKGGVEARGKGIRLQHLTPIPEGLSLGAISEALLASIEVQAKTRRDAEGRTVAERFAEEVRVLQPLPATPFEARRTVLVNVTRQATIHVDTARYSVPSHWKCLQATAYVGIEDLRVECCGEKVCLPKQRRGGQKIQYRHYLSELAKKPQAVRQVAPELIAELGAPFDRLWPLLVNRYGELQTARLIARLLGAIVDHGQSAMAEALESALEQGDAEAIRRTLQPTPKRVPVPEALAQYRVEASRIDAYEGLLDMEAQHE
jgi:hypothetical protein